MNKLSIIQSKIWSDNKFRSLSEDARYLYLYILTSPHSNNIGLFYLPISYISCDLNLNNEKTLSNIKILEEKAFIKYDINNEVMFVSNYLKYNNEFWQQKYNIKKLNKYIIDIPDTYLFIDLKESFIRNIKNNQEYFISIFESLPNVINSYKLNNTITKQDNHFSKENTVLEKSSLENKENNDTNKNNDFSLIEKEPKKKHRKKKTEMNADELSYETFYENYPRKEGKTPGRKNFIKILNNKELNLTAEMLIQSAKNYSNFCLANNRETQYIKLPSTFLGKAEDYKDYLPKTTIQENSNPVSSSQIKQEDNYSLAMNSNPFVPTDDFDI